MPRRPIMRCLATVVVAAAIVGGAPLAASAVEGPPPAPTGAAQQQQQAEVQRLADEITRLQRVADHEGEAAQKANERYLRARAAAARARSVLRDATSAASAAVTRATVSRARASTVAAQLARTDFSTLPLDLMLNHASADRVLGGLSNAGQLQEQAHVLAVRAVTDRAAAQRAQRRSEQRDHEAVTAEDAAERAQDDAREDAAAARQAVEDAKARERALLQRIGDADAGGTSISCEAFRDIADTCADPEAPSDSEGGSIGDRVVAFARAQIGEPYVFAAAGPSAWDCSGLTLGAWRSVGVSIGIHSATAQYRKARDAGRLVPVSEARPGDLLFYTDGGGDMYHITVYAGGGEMVEAPYPGQDVREVPVRTGDLLPQAARIR